MKYVNQRVLQYPLPDNPSPAGLACYQVIIPDDDQHRQLFVSALRTLARWDSYARDAARTGAVAAQTWRNALEYLDFEECSDGCEDEDTVADDLADLADGILSMTQAGGIIKAIGYAIEQAGEFIFNTALPVIGLTFLAIGAAYVITLVVGAITVGTVAVAAGETVEILLTTGAAASNIIEFVATVAIAA